MSLQGANRTGSFIFVLCLFVFSIFYSSICISNEASSSQIAYLNSLSLKELLSVKIATSNLTDTPLSRSPSAITIITREQLERTPARNLMDVLETYVPGLLVISNFTSGPRIRIRGLGERHYSTLLLVNGKPVNQKTHQGAMVELRNWDMADIERVEVVRGPGTVTHGPGAISGVINIITKQARDEEGLEVGFSYDHNYDSKALKLSYATDIGEAAVFLYGSVTRTKGIADYDIFQTKNNGELGYKGTDAFTGTDANPLQPYYADFNDNSQVKLYVDIDFSDEWRLWARYNNSGQVDSAVQKEIQGEMQDWRAFESRYYIFALENRHKINGEFSLSSILSYDSEDYLEIKAKEANLPPTHELNRQYSFSEDELFFRTTLNYQPAGSFSFAGSFEISHDSLSAPWGDPHTSFLVRAGTKGFMSEDSVYFGDGSGGTYSESKVAKFTQGWSTNTFSTAIEMKYQINPELEGIVSGRADKNTLTYVMYSPRLALIYKWDDRNIIKASWQESLRMNTMAELYWLDINEKEAEPEKNMTYELSYSRLQSDKLHMGITGYYNRSEVLTWDGNNANLTGIIKAFGLEPEISYRTDAFSFGINHSFFELLDWDYRLKQDDGSALQTVSYSDMLYKVDYLTLTSTGDSLTDWANQHTKLWFDAKLSDNWTIHMNARIIWEYEYGNDLFDMYDKAFAQVDTAALSAGKLSDYNEDKVFLETYKQSIQGKDAFGKDIRINASVSWTIPSIKGKLTFYGQNLLNLTDNKRQKINFTTKTLPIISWIEEERTLGLNYTQKF
ncbi:TonB-dependent receptor plug domain-containing protein [Colwellia piezophila]|uniref:TonB-dependent receptor plug domain-containing protein n=1 Tax=Colwellia piezophila TaxID=211668 RepID=UPI000368A311|nr:TonB-dependent receptor plug domain-containing protein [Colwellia piezophila]